MAAGGKRTDHSFTNSEEAQGLVRRDYGVVQDMAE